MDYQRAECKECGKVFIGEDSVILAERCAEEHEPIFISVMDFELGDFLNWINSRGLHGKLPKQFTKKMRALQGRVLRGS